MYSKNLFVIECEIGNLFLDPNNPRFWSEKPQKQVLDHKIPDENVQARAFANIERHGIKELSESMLRNGFLTLDRIVVREIDGHQGKYVVVEGNRRLAALKTLRSNIEDETVAEENVSEEQLQLILQDTNTIEVLEYKGDSQGDISWILQGIRHISGIKQWEPAQRAKLVSDQIDQYDMGFKEAGQQFGLSSKAVGRLYRTYKALEQMRSDEDFQSKAENQYFTLFEESIKSKDVRKWLGWDENHLKFKDEDNLHQFYSWIVPDEDNEEKRRIHDPRQIKKLGVLISSKRENLLSLIDQHSLTIDSAYDRVTDEGIKQDLSHTFELIKNNLDDIPGSAISGQATELLKYLELIEKSIVKLRKMAEASQEN